MLMNLVNQYGYLGLFIALALEYFILVVPGETLLTTVGIAARGGDTHFHLLPLVIVTGLGTFSGAMVSYCVGRLFGRPLVKKYGRYVLLTPARFERGELMFERFTVPTLVISRYIAVIRNIVPYVAGIRTMNLRIYAPLMLAASLLWAASFIYLGGMLDQLFEFFQDHLKETLLPTVVIALLLCAIYLIFHRRYRRIRSSAKRKDAGALSNESHDSSL